MITYEERPEIFREHFEECIEHLARLFNSKFPGGKKDRYTPVKKMMDFCGIMAEGTIRRWFLSPKNPPVGVVALKLMCYLDLNGYRVIEFERMPRNLRNLSELLGYSVITAEKVSDLLNCKQVSNVFGICRSDRGLSRDKEGKLWEICKENRDELERKKKDAFKNSRLDFLFATPSTPEVIEQQVLAMSEPQGSISSRRSATICIMRGLLGLLDEGLFQELSENDMSLLEQRDVILIADLSAKFSTINSYLMRTKRK